VGNGEKSGKNLRKKCKEKSGEIVENSFGVKIVGKFPKWGTPKPTLVKTTFIRAKFNLHKR